MNDITIYHVSSFQNMLFKKELVPKSIIIQEDYFHCYR